MRMRVRSRVRLRRHLQVMHIARMQAACACVNMLRWMCAHSCVVADVVKHTQQEQSGKQRTHWTRGEISRTRALTWSSVEGTSCMSTVDCFLSLVLSSPSVSSMHMDMDMDMDEQLHTYAEGQPTCERGHAALDDISHDHDTSHMLVYMCV